MELKAFQRTALQTLQAYLERARLTANPEQAFGETLRQREPERNPPPYRTIPKLRHAELAASAVRCAVGDPDDIRATTNDIGR